MIVSDKEKEMDHIKFLINQARDASKGYYHPEVGFNYRMTNLEASLGLAQFSRLPEFLSKKRGYAEIYKNAFKDYTNIKFQQTLPQCESSYWLPSAVVESKHTIPEIQQLLKEKGIPTRRIFMPIVEFPPFMKYKQESYANAYYIYENGINLPSSTVNSFEQTEYIAMEVLKNA